MKKFFRFNFSPSLTKDFILIHRISVIGIFLVSCLFINNSLDSEKKKIEEKMFASAVKIGETVIYNANYLKYQIYYAAKQIKDTNAVSDKKKIEKILISFAENVNNQADISVAWNAFSWIDKQGKLSVDGGAGIIRNPIDLSSRDYLKITSKIPNKLVLGKSIYGAVSGRFIIPVGMGVFSDDNKYLGTLVFSLDIERVLADINKTIGNETISFAVIRDNNIDFVSDNFQEEDKILTQKILDKFRKYGTPQGKNTISSQGIFSKNKGFICFQNIPNSPLSIIAFYSKEKSYAQILNLFLQQFSLVLLIVFVCIILFHRIYQKIVKPVSKLSQFALRISQKDFTSTPRVPDNKELRDLHRALCSVKEAIKREKILSQKLEIANIKISKANEAKTEFLAKSSHDIKNYIFGICGLTKLILDSKKSAEISANEDLQIVETISDQSEELMRFVEDLLDTVQAESGEFSLGKFKECDVQNLIDRIILLNKSLAIRNHVFLKINIENDLPKLICDERRMKQILVNIINNAIKYSPAESSVNITAKHLQEEKKIYIEIADHGIGMSKEEVNMVFFGQGKNIDKSLLQKEFDSHGIGMSIVLKLVELHGGKIEVESEKGFGTRVKLYFNILSKDVIEAKYLQQEVKTLAENNELEIKNFPPNSKNKTILLVEDNPVNIKITSSILQKEGYKIRHVENGREALEIIDKENFDLILMDGEMPIMNGYQATAAIREGSFFKKFKNYKSIPIIALMSSADDKTIARALESGMNYHIEKSTSKTKLLEVIEGFLKRQS